MRNRAIAFSLIALTVFAILALSPATALAKVPEEGDANRIGIDLTSWQEPLRAVFTSGDVGDGTAGYKGFVFHYERQKRVKGGGYGLGMILGSGTASASVAAGTDSYDKGGVGWTLVGLQPRMIWAWDEQIDVSLGVAAIYRVVEFKSTTTASTTPYRPLTAALTVDLDLAVSERFGFCQSFGLASADGGAYWRWGVTYDFQ